MAAYKTPSAFYDLYYDFTGYAHADYPKDRTAIAKDLAAAIVNQSKQFANGPLIVADQSNIYVYSGDKPHRLLSKESYRATPDSGFYELTSISHVGPAIAYLAALQGLGNDTWKQHLDPLIHHLSAVRQVNAAPLEQHWLNQLDLAVWRNKAVIIKNLIDYACSLAANYLIAVKKDLTRFCSDHISEHFLSRHSQDYPIPYNTVMIGTFALEALASVADIYQALNLESIDWCNAKIILHNLAGTNYGAGLTAGSNWLAPVIQAIAGDRLESDRILILPYSTLPDCLGDDTLSDVQFDKMAINIWGDLYERPLISNAAFPHIDNIDIPYRQPLPGDYAHTSVDQIDDFMKRLKFSISNPKEMLSNTVGFWLAGEAVHKKWQFDKMDLPGVTAGFPKGVPSYPDNAPAIKQ